MRTLSNQSEFAVNEHFVHNASNDRNPLNKYIVKDCTIDFEFQLSNTKHYRIVKFENCIFLKSVTFKNITFIQNFDFINCKFSDKLTLENVVVKGKSRFWKTQFSDIVINNVRFENLADFFKTTFTKKTIFYKTDFLGTTVFTATNFRENVLFTYTKISDVIIFARTKFERGLDLSQAIITGKIKNSNSDFGKFDNIRDIEDDDYYRLSFEVDAVITLNNKRETFRVLKKAAFEDNNQFRYLEYSKLENEAYFAQLKHSWFKRFDNFFIFLLNKVSNNHNMSWSRGIIFTLIIGLLFFYLSLINTESIKIGWDTSLFIPSLGKYFLFLSPLHESKLFEQEITTTTTIFFDSIGRIFVGYGFYQTVQAFRKHKG